MTSGQSGVSKVRGLDALGRQSPPPASVAQNGTSISATTLETTEFLLGSNWVLHPKGLKKFSDELRKKFPDAQVTYELGLGCMKIACLGQDEEAIMALSKSIMDRIVCQEIGDDWVRAQSDMISQAKEWRSNGAGDRKEYAKALAPQEIQHCLYQTVWTMPEELAEDDVAVEKLLPGKSLMKLRQSTGCCVMIASDDNIIHIGAESVQRASVVERKLDMLAKYYVLSSGADIRCESFVYTEDKQESMGAFTYIENGPRSLLTTFFLDRAKYRLAERNSDYGKVFEKGVAISILDNGLHQLGSGPLDITPAVRKDRKTEPYKAFVSASWVYRPKEGSYNKDAGVSVSAVSTSVPMSTELNRNVTSWVSKLPEVDLMSFANKEPESPLLDMGGDNKTIETSSSSNGKLRNDEQQGQQDSPEEQSQMSPHYYYPTPPNHRGLEQPKTPPLQKTNPAIIDSNGNLWPKNDPKSKLPGNYRTSPQKDYRTATTGSKNGGNYSQIGDKWKANGRYEARPSQIFRPREQSRSMTQTNTNCSSESDRLIDISPPRIGPNTPEKQTSKTDVSSSSERSYPDGWVPPHLRHQTPSAQTNRRDDDSSNRKLLPAKWSPPHLRHNTPPSQSSHRDIKLSDNKPSSTAPAYPRKKAFPNQTVPPIKDPNNIKGQRTAVRVPPHLQRKSTVYQQSVPPHIRRKNPTYQQSSFPNHPNAKFRGQNSNADRWTPAHNVKRQPTGRPTTATKQYNGVPKVVKKDSSMVLTDEASQEKIRQLQAEIKNLTGTMKELQASSGPIANARGSATLPKLIDDSVPMVRRSTMKQQAGSNPILSAQPIVTDGPRDQYSEMVQVIGERLTQIMGTLKVFTGEVALKAEIGRFCLTDINQDYVQLQGKGAQARVMPMKIIKKALDRRHVSPGDVMFTNILTANGADMNYLSYIEEDGKRIWLPENRRTIYEIRCRAQTKEGEVYAFVVEIDGDRFTHRVKPATSEACVFFVHCPKRSWDFQVKLSMSQDLEDSFGTFARDLVDSMSVKPQKSGIPVLQFAMKKAYQVDILLVRTSNIASYTRDIKEKISISRDTPASTVLEVSEVHDMHMTNFIDTEDTSIVTFAKYPGNRQLGELPKWYEASIQSRMVNTALLQNRGLEFGDEAEWSAEEFQKAGAFDDILRTTTEMIKKMDGVGYWGDNCQDGLVHGLPPSAGQGSRTGKPGIGRTFFW
ncbi:hypothetical protein F5B20DRAFT_553128 [Whalleya microplaca]|nr:hypothetical protein F5B20DRAFT_553128 [Whalleya microplaca]